MDNFKYSIPTEVFFGRNQIENLGPAVRRYGDRALLVYGGGSIKKTGVYDQVLAQLRAHEIFAAELSGVDPNPRITTVREGIRLCKEQNLSVILAVGGGSAIDCGKVIAAGVSYDGDPWDLILHPELIGDVLPVVTVLTIAATGSEMDQYAVISNPETGDKLDTTAEALRPRVSILDPEFTCTVSPLQTAAGAADIMSHVLESYFHPTKTAYLQDRLAEGILKTCIHYGKMAVEEPGNYEARANLMWSSSLALNDLLSLGAAVAWSVHPIEHELSAHYDITHGVGLAILTPNWMRYVLNKTSFGLNASGTDSNSDVIEKFAEYGRNVWAIDPDLPAFEIATKAVEYTRSYFDSLGLPSTLTAVGIGEEKLELMAEKAAAVGLSNAFVPLGAKDVLEIFRMSM